MTTTLHPYPKYKPSNIDWLDGVPDGWNVRKMKFLFSLLKRPVRDEDEIITAFRDGKVTLRRNRREDGFTIALQESGYQGVRKGNLVIHGMDGFAGAIGISDSDGKATPVYSVCSPKEQDIVPHYYAYLLRTLALTGYIASLARGIRERSTEFKWNIVCNLLLILPPLETQKRIADFLDEKTKIVDELIKKKKKLIEKLREKRVSLFTHAITKGLDPNTKLKSSGIDLLGDIPEGWKVIKLKYLVKTKIGSIKTGPFGSDLTSEDYVYDKENRFAKVYTQQNVIAKDLTLGDEYITEDKYKGLQACALEINDIILTTRGTLGKSVIFTDTAEKGIMHPCLLRVQLNEGKCLKEFFQLIIQESRYFIEQLLYISNATTIDVLYSDTLRSVQIVLPNKEEQKKIIHYSEGILNKFNRIIQENEHEIEKLKEYRSSLIYHAVTGKIRI